MQLNHKRHSLKIVVILFRSLSIISVVFIYAMMIMMMITRPSDAMNEDPSSSELVDNVCNKTSSYKFCTDALNSDPQTSLAEDYYVIAYISFRLAYDNSTNTQRYISQLLGEKNSTSTTTSHDHDLLRRCQGDYKQAIFALSQALDDLNVESFDRLFEYASNVSRSADDCQALFRGTRSQLSIMNGFLKGLSGICLVVSKFF